MSSNIRNKAAGALYSMALRMTRNVMSAELWRLEASLPRCLEYSSLEGDNIIPLYCLCICQILFR